MYRTKRPAAPNNPSPLAPCPRLGYKEGVMRHHTARLQVFLAFAALAARRAVVGLCLAVWVGLTTPAHAAEAPEAFTPFYGSLKAEEVNVRAGPGTQYPILWVYKQSGYPVQAIAAYDIWYKIRDPEGEEGWIYRRFFSQKRTVLINPGEPVTLTKGPSGQHPLLRLEQGVIAELLECEATVCRVEINNYKGWLPRARLLMAD